VQAKKRLEWRRVSRVLFQSIPLPRVVFVRLHAVHVGNVSFQPFDSVAEADESEGKDNPNDCEDEAKDPEENRENPERENCEFVHGVGF
jgi:hypothetical protein